MLLAVHPDFQGMGCGTMLLRHGLELADREGRKTYIESTVAGHPLYLKLGWKDVDLIDVRGKPNWIMIRDPVKQ